MLDQLYETHTSLIFLQPRSSFSPPSHLVNFPVNKPTSAFFPNIGCPSANKSHRRLLIKSTPPPAHRKDAQLMHPLRSRGVALTRPQHCWWCCVCVRDHGHWIIDWGFYERDSDVGCFFARCAPSAPSVLRWHSNGIADKLFGMENTTRNDHVAASKWYETL